MKKKVTRSKKIKKSIFRSAGEVIGTIGHGIATGTDKVMDVAHSVMDTVSAEEKKVVKKKNAVKRAVKKIRKRVLKNATKNKKLLTKKAAKKVVKKAIKKIAKKKSASIRKK